MFKKAVNIFLIITLAIQVLPVQQMGRALFSNVFTEEIPHSVDFEKDCCKKIDGKSEFINWANNFRHIDAEKLTAQCFLKSVAIPHNHSTEILVPPPNC